MFSKLTRLGAAAMIAVVMLSGAAAGSAAAAPAQQGTAGAQTYTVYVGHMYSTVAGEKPDFQFLKFYPGTITINEGDTIVFKHNSGAEPHTASFWPAGQKRPEDIVPDVAPGATPPPGPPTLVLAPDVAWPQGGNTFDGTKYVNSGLMVESGPNPRSWSLTFTKAGSYDGFCILHSQSMPDGSTQGMGVKVTVQAAGSAAKTPAEVETAAQAAMTTDEASAKADLAGPIKQIESTAATQNADGSMTYHVQAGYMNMQTMGEYQRFIPSHITVNQGDSVQWQIMGFHTITFGEEPQLFDVQPQASGPPKLLINSAVIVPVGGNEVTGPGVYNSGVPLGADPSKGPPTFSLKFSQPGRYEYICIPHYPGGMDGSVTVKAMAAGGSVGMPRTGNGFDMSIVALGLLMGVFLMTGGLLVRRRSGRNIA
jgi:plastocyanin